MPTNRRHFRHVEAPTGVGTLHDGERLLATVTYGLRVLQEIIGVRHWSGSSAAKGGLRISGRFSVTSGSLPSDGDQLTLLLADGRVLPFQVGGDGPDYSIDDADALPSVV
jgi:hypothetical protein